MTTNERGTGEADADERNAETRDEARDQPRPARAAGDSRYGPGFYPVNREHPIGGGMSDVVGGLVERVRLPWLLEHRSRVPVLALFSFVNGLISIGIMSILALVTHSTFVFPSLGPTAFLFFYTPTAPTASPRNTIIGHAIGIACGYFSLWVTGLTTAPPATTTGVTPARVIAAALSLALTAGLMVLARSPHPPAGATTLIVSLGILAKPLELVILMGAVILLTIQAFVINRAAGINYPLWNPSKGAGSQFGSAEPSGHGRQR